MTVMTIMTVMTRSDDSDDTNDSDDEEDNDYQTITLWTEDVGEEIDEPEQIDLEIDKNLVTSIVTADKYCA